MPCSHGRAFTDSDWAGSVRTARSTRGGIVMIGAQTIKSYSRQQKVVALSSAEAELYAMVAVSAESIAAIGYAQDLGVELEGEIFTVSSTALGIAHRAGVGKVRHFRTQGLWVQEVRATNRLSYLKGLGTKNPADVLTKHVPADLLERHPEATGMEATDGRAAVVPELSALESVLLLCESPPGPNAVGFAATLSANQRLQSARAGRSDAAVEESHRTFGAALRTKRRVYFWMAAVEGQWLRSSRRPLLAWRS